MEESAPSVRHRLEYAGLSTLVWLIARLPFKALRPLANFLGALVYTFDARGRAVSLANLKAAFGDTMSEARRREVARGGYQTFARTMLELFWSSNVNERVAPSLNVFEGLERWAGHADPTKAGIYVCLHFSNFEWLSLLGAYGISNGTVVAQRFKNPLIGPIFDRLRSVTGNTVIPQERAMIRMLKHLKSGGKFALLGDLNLDPNEPSVVLDTFGGLKICATQMHAAIALKLGIEIIPVECRPLPDGTYKTVYHDPIVPTEGSTVQELAQRTWNALERAIHEQPECWLWSYKHWRFKPADDKSGRYPFYANVAKRFDKLLRESAKKA